MEKKQARWKKRLHVSVDSAWSQAGSRRRYIWFSRQTGYPLDRINAFGCSVIWGHPQGPTGLTSIAELIEELRLRGGGTGLFTGCAAGDTGAALVLRVAD